ncbi:MAG TPA: hypothetical protein VH479_21275 [Acidimicrobiales bacterium]
MHQILVSGLAALVLLLTAACGGSGSDGADDPPRTTGPDPSTTIDEATTTTNTEDAVRSAYSAYVAMITRVSSTTVDPNDPELATRMVDPALSALRTRLSTWQSQGEIWVTGDQTRHDIQSVEFQDGGLTAVVTDCIVANDTRVPVGSTDVTLPAPKTNLGHTTMVNQDGAWLAQSTGVDQQWEGVAGCAA